MEQKRQHLNVVVIGHIDHGKSTFVGRLLMETGAISKHVIDKFRKQAKELGKLTFEYAWVMDNLKEERERGITIDLNHKQFKTKARDFTIIDAPGHRDFVKNMITGTAQADLAILVVSAKEGIKSQTEEHIFLAKTLGIDKLIIAVNKMDEIQYDEKRYASVESEILNLAKRVGYRDVTLIPTSAYYGDNIYEKSEQTKWYKGVTIIQKLDTIEVKNIDTSSKPLRLPIEDVCSITGIGTVPVGRVESGILLPNQKVVFLPSGKTAEVKSIQMHHETFAKATPGMNVGFNIRGVSKDEIRRGEVACSQDSLISVPKSFIAKIFIFDHPTVISKGYIPVLHCHTAQIACRFESIISKINPLTGKVIEENPSFLKKGDLGEVRLVPITPLAIEQFDRFPKLSRFAIRDMGKTVAAGFCTKVEEN